MDKLNILHISDLHWEPKKQRDIKVIKEALFTDLDKLWDEKRVKPDIVVLSGDFIFSGDYGYSNNRNDYNNVKTEIIAPLLNELNLTNNDFFFCPGNHDIQRSLVNEYVDDGLKNKLKSNSELNKLLGSFDKNEIIFTRMQNFEKFKASINNDYIINTNVLFTTYVKEVGEYKVGIACINSAWRAYGGENDYGKLSIGGRVIEQCIKDLQRCDLKIGVAHHPFEYLQEFERVLTKRRVYEFFNIWLTGHTHNPEYELVETYNNDRIVTITGGAFYQSMEYYNGYSVIQIRLPRLDGDIFLREYSHRGGYFVPALAYNEDDGIKAFELTKHPIVSSNTDLILVSKLYEVAETQNKGLLFPAFVDNNLVQKDFKDVFVKPRLCSIPKYEKDLSVNEIDGADAEFISVDAVLGSKESYLFIGGKESGKTTLLKYLYMQFVQPNKFEKALVPLFISANKFTRGKNRIEKAIRGSLDEKGVDINSTDLINDGNWVLIIDDLEVTDTKNIAALSDFVNKYPNNRFMFSVSEDVLDDIKGDSVLDIREDLHKLYIYPFARKQIRRLISNWFQDRNFEINPGELADLVLTRTSEINIPNTPFIIIMILLILEQQRDYAPANKAMLVENIIELLLEKTYTTGAFNIGIDYKNLEDFLASLAYHMVSLNKDQLLYEDILSFADQYFEDVGFVIYGGIHKFVDSLVERGVLVKNDMVIRFRFNGFFEYFVAKWMIEDKEFYQLILSDDHYLNYYNEIDYLTGIQRKNKDVIRFLAKRTTKNLKNFISAVESDKLELSFIIKEEKSLRKSVNNLEIDVEVSEEQQVNVEQNDIKDNREALLEKIRGEKITEDMKDDMYEMMHSHVGKDERENHDGSLPENKYEKYETKLLKSLLLYSNVIRNCELINLEFKKENFNNCVRVISEFSDIATQRLQEQVEEMDIEQITKLASNLPGQIEDTLSGAQDNTDLIRQKTKLEIKQLLFIIFGLLLHSEIGSPKLKVVVDDGLNSDLPLRIRLMILMLLIDLKMPGYVDKILEYIEEFLSDASYRRIILQKLMVHYSYFANSMTRRNRSKLENLIADLHFWESGDKRAKSAFIGKHLKRKFGVYH